MKRIISVLLWSAVGAGAVALAACGDDSASVGPAYGYGGGPGYGVSCAAYTTCGTCTPVPGCGWCFNGSTGICTTDPDSCDSLSEFTWTWDSTGCPGVDASVVPLDAGAATVEASAPEASLAEASAPAMDASLLDVSSDGN